MAKVEGNYEVTLNKFETGFSKLPIDVQTAVRELISEINEVGLEHIRACVWRGSQIQFEFARPVLQIISPSITGEVNERGTFCATWNTNDFILPDIDNLDEVISPLAECEPGYLCRSDSGWADPHSSYTFKK